MPSTISTTVYSFDELSDSAKERAREWWRIGQQDSIEWDYMYDDFRACGKLLGIDIGGTDAKPDIYWSGFSSQGDGASFAGEYRYAKDSAKAIRAHVPQDNALHAIADALANVQRKYFYSLTANVSAGHGRYSHEMTMRFDVEGGHDVAESDIEEVRETLRDFARWMYRQLEREYDYQMSDAVVDENMQINEYTFTESGTRFG